MTVQQNTLYLRGTKMIMNVSGAWKAGLHLASKNAPAMLTAFGTVGAVTTAVLAAKASFAASDRINEETIERNLEVENDKDIVHLSKAEKVKLVWPLYIGAVSSGVLTCGAIIMAHRISARRAAVLAAAYALNEGKLEEYQEKIKEKFGVKEEKEARDEIAQDKVNRLFENGSANDLFFNPLSGKVLIMEAYTGRPFYSTKETIDRAVNEINHEITKDNYVRLSEFYDLIDLDHVSTSDYVGWNTHERCEIDWSTTTTPDGSQAVLVFDYVNPPILNPGDGASFR